MPLLRWRRGLEGIISAADDSGSLLAVVAGWHRLAAGVVFAFRFDGQED
jgi:hypothetical protein